MPKFDRRYGEMQTWVVDKVTGRIGLIHSETARKCIIQFGSGGPFESVWNKDLRRATETEIDKVTGQ